MSDDLPAALAHAFLCAVCAHRVRDVHIRNYTCLGLHTNLFVHGILGIINFQKSAAGKDVAEAYKLSLAASRYLPLACIMADVRRSDDVVSALHALLGIIPFVMAVSGSEDGHMGRTCIFINILAVMYYALDKGDHYSWYTAAAGLVAYFGVAVGGDDAPKFIYPLALAAIDHCGYMMLSTITAVLR